MYVQKSWGHSGRGPAVRPRSGRPPPPPPPARPRAHQQLLLLLVGLRGHARVALVVAVDEHHAVAVLGPLLLHHREGAGRPLPQHALLQPHRHAPPQLRHRHLHRLAQLLQAPAGCGQGGRAHGMLGGAVPPQLVGPAQQDRQDPHGTARPQRGDGAGGGRAGRAYCPHGSGPPGSCPPSTHPPPGTERCPPGRRGQSRAAGGSPWSWKYSRTTACTGVTATDRVRSASSTSMVTRPKVCFQLSVRMAWGGLGSTQAARRVRLDKALLPGTG